MKTLCQMVGHAHGLFPKELQDNKDIVQSETRAFEARRNAVEQSVAADMLIRQRARIRPIASPEGASCVERLLDPYPALLERQLTRMRESRV